MLLLALQQPGAARGACTAIPHDRVFSPRNILTSAEEAISLAGWNIPSDSVWLCLWFTFAFQDEECFFYRTQGWFVEAKAILVSVFLFFLSRYWGWSKKGLLFQSQFVLDIIKKKMETRKKESNEMWENPSCWARASINQCKVDYTAHGKVGDVGLIHRNWEFGTQFICEK